MIRDPLLFDEEHHAESLEHLTMRALSAGDFKTAFLYADRRCRISPIAKPHHYVLRAEASYHSGAREEAIADLARALALAPDNLMANGRMLAWAKGAPQIEAARRLIRKERNFAVLASAIKTLGKEGEQAVGAIEHTDGQISGWVAWSGKAPLRVTIEGGHVVTRKILPDPSHPLSSCLGSAAAFAFERCGSGEPSVVSVRVGRRTILEKRIRGVARANPSKRQTAPSPSPSQLKAPVVATAVSSATAPSAQPAGKSPLVVIVPVYDDYEATKECLDSLLAELEKIPDSRAIFVDDASPDPSIKAHLKILGRNSSIQLITNPHNLGFVESINRALATVHESDVVLLNADTILPPGCLGRLRDASRAAPAIGTVTPLEQQRIHKFSDFPNEPNPVLSAEKISRLDTAAAAANAGVLIDIPNGTGFCLYITRECLGAVGALSNAYERGYLEDADLCLRARERGFRNVCAPSVYIGHVGSRSFGAEKRSLVVQNLTVIETRFPHYRADCGAFVSADPLRVSRAAIELSVTPEPDSVLLVTGSGPLTATTSARAGALVEEGFSALILEIRPLAEGPVARIFDSGEGIPQSLAFRIYSAEDLKLLGEYLARAKLARVEIVDPAHVPGTLLELLLTLNAPLDLLIADAGLVCPRGTLTRSDRKRCNAKLKNTCEGCHPLYQKNSRPCDHLRRILAKAMGRCGWPFGSHTRPR